MLKIRSLSKQFKAGNFGVRDFSLEVESGVLGLLGPNGAGTGVRLFYLALASGLMLVAQLVYRARAR